MKTIIVCDAIHKVGFEILNREEDIKVIDAVNVPKDKLLDILGEADVAITRSSTEVGEAFLNAAKNLKALVRAGVGVDNVDIARHHRDERPYGKHDRRSRANDGSYASGGSLFSLCPQRPKNRPHLETRKMVRRRAF